ncbi:hypothetical protein ACFLRZ_05795, partial [Bacteroidota bacterium]
MTGKQAFYRVNSSMAIIMLIAIALSCSTKKNTFTRRVYHNLTSHYNAYWNGKESYNLGVSQLAVKQKDDYNKVLSIYQYGTEDDAQSVYPQMDRAIEKATKVIQKHSIFVKRREHVKWIDDSYLLMGKAHLYKKDYRQAFRTFDFIVKRYSKNPIRFDAMIWMARIYNIQERFPESQSILDEVQNKIKRGKADKKLEKQLSMAFADFYIQQENYGPAIEYIQTALGYHHPKDIKNRLRFILAQIYQKNGYFEQATNL